MDRRVVPHDNLYKWVGKYSNYSDILLYSSAIVSLAISALNYHKLLPALQGVLIGLNCCLIGLLLYFDNRGSYLYTRAEMRRRLDWLDNSFDTNFSGKRSENYFTNEHLSPGLYKLAVNCFENSFHSQAILSRMMPSIIGRAVVITVCFILSSYFGNSEFVRMFFEVALPAVVVQKMIRVIIYSSRMGEVLDRFKSLFNDLMRDSFDNKTAEALRDILEYETALAWASTPLSSKVFFKHKDELADDWAELKRKYNIA
jgi:hypothetical protein